MSDLKNELKVDSHSRWAKIRRKLLNFSMYLPMTVSVLGTPTPAKAQVRIGEDSNNKPSTERVEGYTRVVDYQVDTSRTFDTALAYFSATTNSITANYDGNQTNTKSSLSCNIAHEANHRDIHLSKLRTAPMSLEQNYKVNCHEEISSYIVGAMQVRQEYLEAKTDAERESIEKANTRYSFYFDALRSGEITNKHSNEVEFDAEMKFIARNVQKIFMDGVESGNYDRQMYEQVMIFFDEHDYKDMKPNDENYQAYIKQAYNIGGLDFSKYLDDIECKNGSVIEADKLIQLNVNRSQINDVLVLKSTWDDKVAKEREDAEFLADMGVTLKPYKPMSLEQVTTLTYDRSRVKEIHSIMNAKFRFFNASSDEERQALGEKISNENAKKYYEALMRGEIKTSNERLSEDDLNFINNMNYWVSYEDCADRAVSHLKTHGNNAVRNDENFEAERSEIYTIGGIDYSKDISPAPIQIKGLNVIEADNMLEGNEDVYKVQTFLETSKGIFDIFYDKGEINSDLSPAQQMRIAEHKLFLQNMMLKNGASSVEKLAKYMDRSIKNFGKELKMGECCSNYLFKSKEIIDDIAESYSSRFNIPKDNDKLYQEELAKVYTVDGVNLLEHFDGNIEDALPKFAGVEAIKNVALEKLANLTLKDKINNRNAQKEEYYRFKLVENSNNYDDPIYRTWSEDMRVSDVQYIEIYDFRSNILKDQRDYVELKGLSASLEAKSEKFDNSLDESLARRESNTKQVNKMVDSKLEKLDLRDL